MFLLLFTNSEIPWLNLGILLIVTGTVIFMLKGKINPKLSFWFISFLLGGLISFQFMQGKSISTKTTSPLTLIDRNNLEKIIPSITPVEVKKPRPKSYDDVPEKKVNPVSKYQATIAIKGIEDKIVMQQLEEKSRYRIVKNGDYLVEFSANGTIKEGNIEEGSRLAHSGGHLIIKVGGERCYYSKKAMIPVDLPLGNRVPQANQIIQKRLEEYIAKNKINVISAMEECLPKY